MLNIKQLDAMVYSDFQRCTCTKNQEPEIELLTYHKLPYLNINTI